MLFFTLVSEFALLLEMKVSTKCAETIIVGIIVVLLWACKSWISALIFLPRFGIWIAHSTLIAFHSSIHHASSHSTKASHSPISLRRSVIKIARSIGKVFAVIAKSAGSWWSLWLLFHLTLIAHSSKLLAWWVVESASIIRILIAFISEFAGSIRSLHLIPLKIISRIY